VTIQAQLLDLLADLQRDRGTAILLITHDLGVVARMADNVAVMYAGQIVEQGSVDDIFYRPAHPYTVGLRAAMPTNARDSNHRLLPIEGSPPDLFAPPAACAYAARCPHAMRICTQEPPPAFAMGPGHFGRCWLHHDAVPGGADTIRRGTAS
jgi:oligopeptide/dipeptide ABC transporter ATP-binding protein